MPVSHLKFQSSQVLLTTFPFSLSWKSSCTYLVFFFSFFVNGNYNILPKDILTVGYSKNKSSSCALLVIYDVWSVHAPSFLEYLFFIQRQRLLLNRPSGFDSSEFSFFSPRMSLWSTSQLSQGKMFIFKLHAILKDCVKMKIAEGLFVCRQIYAAVKANIFFYIQSCMLQFYRFKES